MNRHCYLLFGTLFFVSNNLIAKCQTSDQYSLYYLCIGSAHYTDDFTRFEKGFNGMLNVEEALFSARKMEALFRSWGAVDGQLLLSGKSSFITAKKVDQALQSVLNSIKKNKTPNPFVIVYYCGHGFSNDKLEALFLPPGDFVKDPKRLTLEGWNKYGISPLDISEKFEAPKIPFMMFLDCCYSGKQLAPERFSKAEVQNFGLETLDQLMGDTYQLFTAMFRMVGPDPVFFSTPAGTAAETVPFSAIDSINFSGPLCRRAHVLHEQIKTKSKFSVKEWTEAFLRPDLDIVTQSVKSYWVYDDQNLRLLMRQ